MWKRANKCLVQKSKSRSKSRSKSGKNNRQKEVEGFESRNKVNGKNEHLQSVLNRCQNYTSPRAKKNPGTWSQNFWSIWQQVQVQICHSNDESCVSQTFCDQEPRNVFFFHQMPKNASSWALTRKIIFGRFKKSLFWSKLKTCRKSRKPEKNWNQFSSQD